MDTNNLKRFAKEARLKLLNQVGRKLEFVLTHDTAELRGKEREIAQLRSKIQQTSKEQVVEMVSYTWFNRLMAQRFMDANGYNIPKVITPLPGMTNPEILQNALGGNIEPDLKLDRQRINDLFDGRTAATDAHTEAYKMLLVASCNQWHTTMPFMFERISDYTELLLPDDLLSDYSIVADIRNGMSDEDCQQEELIGWLYQFYIADKKDDVFEGLKKNIKITAENIPAATQLFTPRWIVRYMVENTLGKLWLTLKPNSKLREHMPYFIEAPEGNAPAPIPEDLLTTNNQQLATKITFLDPCQGSGHVLVYAFDLFSKIYEEEGYNTNEIPALILEHNLFGIDIDERAAQLAAFALTMKARSCYPRFLRKPVQPNVIALENCSFTKDELNLMIAPQIAKRFDELWMGNVSREGSFLFDSLKTAAKNAKIELPENTFNLLSKALKDFSDEESVLKYLENIDNHKSFITVDRLFEGTNLNHWLWNYVNGKYKKLKYEICLFNELDNFGSLVNPTNETKSILLEKLGTLDKNDVFQNSFIEKILLALKQAEYLSRQYHCVVTNPPYLGQRSTNAQLRSFVDSHYKKGKSDLMACFIERCLSMVEINGLIGMITQQSWMFLSSYQELRCFLVDNIQFMSMLHLGAKTFPEIGGEVVQNTSFTFSKHKPINDSIFIRLTGFDNHKLKEEKTLYALQNSSCNFQHIKNQVIFKNISGSPIGYWNTEKVFSLFKNNKELSKRIATRQGMATGDNETFLRYWFEISQSNFGESFESIDDINVSDKRWVPYNKGGAFRKWYGNYQNVVAFSEKDFNILSNQGNHCPSRELYFKPAITWTLLVSNTFGARVQKNHVFDVNGLCAFPEEELYNYILGFFCSKVSYHLLSTINPTLAFQKGNIDKLPLCLGKLNNRNRIDENIKISKNDWDNRELSWNFQQNELIKQQTQSLKVAFESFIKEWSDKFYELHRNEEELNRQFIEIYGLQDELTPDVPLEEITILQEEAKILNGELFIEPIQVLLQLVSYSVGCIFGRYSLDKPGLILANQGETLQDFLKQVPSPSFMPDEDNIIPVLDGEWFTDDIVGRFKVFLKAAFGDEHFEENLKYIEDTIGKDIRKYFVKDFYNDHIKRYKKRPIYWMFSSPKGHFKALIYMHRYQPDLCSKMLNDYLQAFISKLETAKQTQTMLSLREDISAREKTVAIKEIDKYEAMLKDCREYEKTLFTIATQKISIDLDDGVKVNYQKFKEVLVPIKGLDDVDR